MTSVTVETGAIVEGANSYVSEMELGTFAAARGITLTGDSAELLTKAMDYIESLLFKGVKRTRNQPLQWPRVDVYIDGYYVDSDTIPTNLKNGQMQVALSIDAGMSPQQTIGRKTIKEKVGDLEIDYASSSSVNTLDIKINGFLWKLLAGCGYGSNTINVSKG